MDSSVAIDLPDLKAQLDQWRQSHRKRARIPDHFYKTAISLLNSYSVSTICRETRLRPASLRKHAATTCSQENSSAPTSTSFLQFNAADLMPHPLPPEAQRRAPAAASASFSRLLFERADGSRLTPHLASPDPQHLEALCLSLLRS